MDDSCSSSLGEMRILLIDPEEAWAGGEQQVEYLARGLRARGLDVEVAASPNGELFRRLQAEFPIWALRMQNDLAVRKVFSLARYCRERRIDVVDAHTARGHSLGFALRLFASTPRLVVHRHIDLPPKPTNRFIYRSRRVDRFIAISSKVRDVLLSSGVPADRISLIRSTVDAAPFRNLDRSREHAETASRLGVGADRALIGSIAQLAPYKGHAVLLEALSILRKQGQGFHCVIAGEGRLRAQLDSRIAELKLTDSVTMLGFRRDVPRLMAGLDIFVMPSITEGLGLAILEAFHAGTPVVASNTGGIPELVEHDVTGLLSPPGDATALADNLKRLLLDPDLRQRLATNGRRLACERYRLDDMIDATLGVYRDVLNDRAAGDVESR